MKNLNNNLNFTSNPSYLGADRLWAGSDELIGDTVIGIEYDVV